MIFKQFLKGIQIGAIQIRSYKIEDSNIYIQQMENERAGAFDDDEYIITEENGYFIDENDFVHCDKFEICEGAEILLSMNVKTPNPSQIKPSELICDYCGQIYEISKSKCPFCEGDNPKFDAEANIVKKEIPREIIETKVNSNQTNSNMVNTELNQPTMNIILPKEQNNNQSGELFSRSNITNVGVAFILGSIIVLAVIVGNPTAPVSPNINPDSPTDKPDLITMPSLPINGNFAFTNNSPTIQVDGQYKINILMGWLRIQLFYEYDPDNGKSYCLSVFGKSNCYLSDNQSKDFWFSAGVLPIIISQKGSLAPPYIITITHIQNYFEPNDNFNASTSLENYTGGVACMYLDTDDVDWYNITDCRIFTQNSMVVFDIYYLNGTISKSYQQSRNYGSGNFILKVYSIDGSKQWYDLTRYTN